MTRTLDGTFAPYDSATQPVRRIVGYPNTQARTPVQAPVARVITAGEMSGPVFAAPRPEEANLTVTAPGRPRAMGQLLHLTGRVLDENGRPMAGVLLEIWQCNAAGKYIHHNDPSPVPVDPNFLGVGRAMTDGEGRYRIRTIKPAGYAVPEHAFPGTQKNWWRPPHIHFSLFGPAFTSRLITQMFFPGEPLNGLDLILNAIPDAAARARLVATFAPHLNTDDGALGFVHDFVLRGRQATPSA
jgi:protocatechuate 3,4-dioxygenase beta subunit